MLIPLALIISYGIARVAALAFGELRNAFFSKVAQNAITQLTLNTFKHLHSLSLQFHLGRQTGALSKFIDRGTKGVNFLLTYVLFNVIPTIIEIFLVAGILSLYLWMEVCLSHFSNNWSLYNSNFYSHTMEIAISSSNECS